MEGATNVYIDGFNFYYGAVKGGTHKWLDFDALARRLLRGHHLGEVKYFTARVDDRPDDPSQSQRQDIYLSALATIPSISIHLGQFRTTTKTVLLVSKKPKVGAKPRFAQARVTEEKGTDVSLGAHLVWDACHGKISSALVFSNDSDLQTPVDMAMELGVKVITVNPHRHSGQADHLHGDDRRKLHISHLANSQLPNKVTDSKGRVFRKPKAWA